jgi:hypothetical protein
MGYELELWLIYFQFQPTYLLRKHIKIKWNESGHVDLYLSKRYKRVFLIPLVPLLLLLIMLSKILENLLVAEIEKKF